MGSAWNWLLKEEDDKWVKEVECVNFYYPFFSLDVWYIKLLLSHQGKEIYLLPANKTEKFLCYITIQFILSAWPIMIENVSCKTI